MLQRESASWRACSSGVEHLPFKQRVDGSNPSTLTDNEKLKIQKKVNLFFILNFEFLIDCPDGGTGRHTVLRGRRPKGHASSSLAPGTNQANPILHLPWRSCDEKCGTQV